MDLLFRLRTSFSDSHRLLRCGNIFDCRSELLDKRVGIVLLRIPDVQQSLQLRKLFHRLRIHGCRKQTDQHGLDPFRKRAIVRDEVFCLMKHVVDQVEDVYPFPPRARLLPGRSSSLHQAS
jgi:hypothetical protein